MNINACVKYTFCEKIIPIITAVYIIIVPIVTTFLPQRSANSGMNAPEKAQPIKKLIPIKAIIYFETHSR
jgi:hypothetical protein